MGDETPGRAGPEQNPIEGDEVPPERKEEAPPKPGPSMEGSSIPTTEPIDNTNNTVKKILNEILDCTIIPTTATPSSRALSGGNEVAVKDILGEILDCTIRKKSETETEEGSSDLWEAQPGPSRVSRSEPCMLPAIYTILNVQDSLEVLRQQRPSLPRSLYKLLPSYSSVMKLTPPRRQEAIVASESFVSPIPPPRYPEIDDNMWGGDLSMVSFDRDSMICGPDPMYAICPRCRIVVMTDTVMEHSFLTHLLALGMCMFLCWPCCLLPYCMKTFSNIYHHCPYCGHYFGSFRPI